MVELDGIILSHTRSSNALVLLLVLGKYLQIGCFFFHPRNKYDPVFWKSFTGEISAWYIKKTHKCVSQKHWGIWGTALFQSQQTLSKRYLR